MFARSLATRRARPRSSYATRRSPGAVRAPSPSSGSRLEARVPRELLQLQQGVLLDLPDPLAGQTVLLADLRQGALAAVVDAVAHLDDGRRARVEAADEVVEFLAA